MSLSREQVAFLRGDPDTRSAVESPTGFYQWCAVELSELVRGGLTVTIMPKFTSVGIKCSRGSEAFEMELPVAVSSFIPVEATELLRRAILHARHRGMLP